MKFLFFFCSIFALVFFRGEGGERTGFCGVGSSLYLLRKGRGLE